MGGKLPLSFPLPYFLPKTGAGAGKAVAKTVAKYMGIRKRTHTNEYSTKTDGSRTAAGCTHSHRRTAVVGHLFFVQICTHHTDTHI